MYTLSSAGRAGAGVRVASHTRVRRVLTSLAGGRAGFAQDIEGGQPPFYGACEIWVCEPREMLARARVCILTACLLCTLDRGAQMTKSIRCWDSASAPRAGGGRCASASYLEMMIVCPAKPERREGAAGAARLEH